MTSSSFGSFLQVEMQEGYVPSCIKDKVDYWMLVYNAHNPRIVVADNDGIYNSNIYKKIEAYVTE